MEKYPKYKDSGVKWIGEIPEHWEVRYLFQVSKQHFISNKTVQHQNLLSLSYGNIISKDINKTDGLLPASFDTYQVVKDGNIILRLTDLQNDKKSLRVGLVKEEGIITSAYVCLEVFYSIDSNFLYKTLHSFDIKKVFYSMGGGLRQNLNYNELRKLSIILPPLSEQHAIVSFLEKETSQIESYIKLKEQEVERLNELKQAKIAHVVTKGLDPNVKMKDSGIAWIGDVPEHWEVLRAKNMFFKNKRKVRDDDEVITCFRDGQVTLRKNRRTTGFTESINETGYQGIRKGDLVIHQMDAFAGAIGVSDSDGKGTSVYHCCTPKDNYDTHYYAYLIRIMAYSGFIQSLYRGIRERSSDFNFTVFGNQYLVIPPFIEQQQIVSHIETKVNQIDTYISITKREIEQMQEYKQRLISDAVTGKIKV